MNYKDCEHNVAGYRCYKCYPLKKTGPKAIYKKDRVQKIAKLTKEQEGILAEYYKSFQHFVNECIEELKELRK